jgi:hypothetical protein
MSEQIIDIIDKQALNHYLVQKFENRLHGFMRTWGFNDISDAVADNESPVAQEILDLRRKLASVEAIAQEVYEKRNRSDIPLVLSAIAHAILIELGKA